MEICSRAYGSRTVLIARKGKEKEKRKLGLLLSGVLLLVELLWLLEHLLLLLAKYEYVVWYSMQ